MRPPSIAARREPHAVLLHDEASAYELAQLEAIDTELGRGRAAEGRRLERRDERVTGERIGGTGRTARPPPTVDSPSPASASSTARSRSSSVATSSPSSPAASIVLAARSERSRERFGVDDPTADVGVAAFAGEPLELVDRDPAPLGDDAVDRPVGPGLGRRHDRVDVEHLAAADGLRSAALAQHVAVAGHERQSRSADAAGRSRRSPGAMRSGPRMRSRTGVLAAADVRDDTRRAATRRGRARRARGATRRMSACDATGRPDERVAAADLVVVHAGEVHGRSVAGPDRVVRLRLVTAGPARAPRASLAPRDEQLVADAQPAAGQRARHHRAGAGGCERPVDPQPRPVAVDGASACRVSRRSSASRSSPSPTPVGASTATTSAPSRNVPGDVVGDVEAGQLGVVVVDEADLRERDHAVAMPSSSRMRRCSSDCGFQPSVAATTNRQASTAPTPASMFLRKRTWPGTSTNATPLPGRQRRPREAEVDGEAAPLLLGEPVGVHAGEREDERRLAVIDVARGGDDVHRLSGGRAAALWIDRPIGPLLVVAGRSPRCRCRRLVAARRVEAHPLADRQPMEVDGEVGVDEQELVASRRGR